MKRIPSILLVFFTAAAATSFFIKPLILSVSRRQLEGVCRGSSVSVAGAQLSPWGSVSLSGISIRKQPSYFITIRRIKIEYSLSSLLKASLKKILVDGLSVTIATPRDDLSAFRSELTLGPPGVFKVGAIEISGAQGEIQSKDLRFVGRGSAGINLSDSSLYYVDLKIDTFDGAGLKAKDVVLKARQGEPRGIILTGPIEYNKLKIKAVKGSASLKEKVLFLEGVSVQTLDGDLTGHAAVRMEGPVEYSAEFSASGLDLKAAVDDFELSDKMEMTGGLTGDLQIKGKGDGGLSLNGAFSVVSPGGTLIIKDKRVIQTIAKSTKQSFDAVVESFKDYHYGKGDIRLGLEGKDLRVGIFLEGEQGKRSIDITVHDASWARLFQQ